MDRGPRKDYLMDQSRLRIVRNLMLGALLALGIVYAGQSL